MLLIDANERRKSYYAGIIDGYPSFTRSRGLGAEIPLPMVDLVLRQLQQLCPQRLIVVDPGPGLSYQLPAAENAPAAAPQ